jgi:hypothetical protein
VFDAQVAKSPEAHARIRGSRGSTGPRLIHAKLEARAQATDVGAELRREGDRGPPVSSSENPSATTYPPSHGLPRLVVLHDDETNTSYWVHVTADAVKDNGGGPSRVGGGFPGGGVPEAHGAGRATGSIAPPIPWLLASIVRKEPPSRARVGSAPSSAEPGVSASEPEPST